MRRVLSLFAGIEGFGLGLESTGGFKVTHAVELEDFPREVIAARCPDIEIHVDVCEFDGKPLRGAIETICGGFPCQDLSVAGRGEGLKGARSGLWSEYARIIGEIEPELVLIENVPMLLRRGFEQVVADLTAMGYGVEWDCLPAAAFGAWHLRDRVWVVGHKLGEPSVFGPTAGLFGLPPAQGEEYGRWARAGFAESADHFSELAPLAPIAGVRAGAVVPTPKATDGDRGGRGDLLQVVRGNTSPSGRWPTPAAADGLGGRNEMGAVARAIEGGATDIRTLERPSGAKAALSLGTAVQVAEQGLWPTPKASPSGPDYARAARENSGGDDLATAVARKTKGQLNPTWVEWLMGFPLGWTDLSCKLPEWASWDAEPEGIARVAENVERRNARLRTLGNALVPPAAAWVGTRVLAAVGAVEAAA